MRYAQYIASVDPHNAFMHFHADPSQRKLMVHRGTYNFAEISVAARQACEALFREGFSETFIRRVHGVIVELLENMLHHGVAIADGATPLSCFAVHLGPNREVYIYSGNPLHAENAPVLEKHLTKIQSMSHGELKSAFFTHLVEGKVSRKGGAGVGLMGVARTASKFSWSIDPINEQFVYLSLTVRMNEKQI